MRDIKFRGKNIDSGEWVYGHYGTSIEIGDNGGVEHMYRETCTKLHYIVSEDGSKSYVVYPNTVGQYIGKKDKNNKSTYKDDIVTGSNYPYKDDGELSYIGIIRWCDIELGYYIELYCINNNKRGISNGIPHGFCDIANIEVIGNIHDNPELIGGK